jgi:hypothetical protein
MSRIDLVNQRSFSARFAFMIGTGAFYPSLACVSDGTQGYIAVCVRALSTV